MKAHPANISACIISFNEADRIAGCIQSLDFCDEVLVVDSHSTDGTREVAEREGARVIERDWPGFMEQKEFAIRQAQHDWVLCLDADERVEDTLRREISELRERGFAGKAGWSMPRMSWYLGKWIRYGTWYPDRQLRLFDRRRGRWGGEILHDHVILDGEMGRLSGHILHRPYRSVSEHLRTIDSYTTTAARGLHARGNKGSVLNLLLNPPIRFVRYYILKRGFLDGWRGLAMGMLASYYVALKYIKLLALSRTEEEISP